MTPLQGDDAPPSLGRYIDRGARVLVLLGADADPASGTPTAVDLSALGRDREAALVVVIEGRAGAHPAEPAAGIERFVRTAPIDSGIFDDPAVQLGSERFDAVIADGVVAGATDPVGLLRGSAARLQDGGHLVVREPNVSHADGRLAVLRGAAPAATGTTKAALTSLLQDAGLLLVALARTHRPLDRRLAADLPEDTRDAVLAELDRDPEATVQTYTAVAVPGPPAEPSALTALLLSTAAELDDARAEATARGYDRALVADAAERVEEAVREQVGRQLLDARLEALAARQMVPALEQQLAAVASRLAGRDDAAIALDDERLRWHTRARELQLERDEMAATRWYRLGEAWRRRRGTRAS